MARSVSHVDCRTFGHAWDRTVPKDARVMSSKYTLTLRCTRCGCVRSDGLDQWGQLDARYYDYPDDYRIPRDDMPARSELRLMLVRADRANGRQKVGAR